MKIMIECESEFEARRCMQAMSAWMVLRDLDEQMRQRIKYGDEPDQVTHQWRQMLHELCDDRGVMLDDDEASS